MAESKSIKICSVEGCASLVKVKGFCNKHYQRWRTHGNTHRVRTKQGEPLAYLKKLNKASATNECIEWPFSTDRYGYGRIYFNGTATPIGRVILLLQGEPPFEGAVAGHLCTTRACSNPSHFSWITNLQNSREDRYRDGTMVIGEDVHTAKLTVDQVLQIREDYANGTYSQARLASAYGVTRYTISDIVRRRSWRHI